MEDRLPPQAVEAERDVLGAMLIDRDACDTAESILRASDFYVGKHRIIYAAAVKVYDETQALELPVLREALTASGELEAAGGAEYLAGLAAAVPTAAAVERMARLVKDKAICREFIAAGTNLVRDAFEAGREASQVASAFSATLTVIEERLAGGSRDTSITSILRDMFNSLDKEKQPGLKTGLRQLDDLTCGFLPGETVIIAAPPGQGKSTLALNFARAWALQKIPVLVCSYEMGREQIGRSIASAEGRVCIGKDGGSPDPDKALDACNRLNAVPLDVEDRPLALGALLATLRMYRRKHGIQAAVIDYLQLVPVDRDCETREREVAMVSRALKLCARDLGLVIVACCQLNRAWEGRPQLKNLRESGALEQDADNVIFIHDPAPGVDAVSKHMQLILAKARESSTGNAEVQWERGWRLFTDYCPPAGQERTGEPNEA